VAGGAGFVVTDKTSANVYKAEVASKAKVKSKKDGSSY